MSSGRRVAAILSVAMAAIIGLAGGVFVWAAHLGIPEAPANAALTIEAQISGSDLTVRGTTDLPDGTLVKVTAADVRVESYRAIDAIVNVSDGRYVAPLSVSGWRPGGITVSAGFAPGYPGQPAEVVNQFGPSGERLTGPHVVHDWDGGDVYLEVGTQVTLPE